jgi:hypothetical protein
MFSHMKDTLAEKAHQAKETIVVGASSVTETIIEGATGAKETLMEGVSGAKETIAEAGESYPELGTGLQGVIDFFLGVFNIWLFKGGVGVV